MDGNETFIIKRRNSSIELYRIIATFTVLIVHFNGWFAGGLPGVDSLSNASMPEICQIMIQSSTIICVNMFLLISGYFGIKLKLESILRILLLLLFIKIPFYFVEVFYKESFSLTSFIGQFFVVSQAGYFIQCYLFLMFLSPVLNSFVEKYKKSILPWTLSFLLMEFWFGCIMNIDALGFNHGYSVIHFVLMYMLARNLSLYKDYLVKIEIQVYWGGYVICTVLIFFLFFLHIQWAMAYSNPIVVASSVCSFVPFLYKDFHNGTINWIAGSTFAVYILQVTHPIYDIIIYFDKTLKEAYPYPIYWLAGIGILLCFFAFCIVYDKLCDLFIRPIVKRILLVSNGKYNFIYK